MDLSLMLIVDRRARGACLIILYRLPQAIRREVVTDFRFPFLTCFHDLFIPTSGLWDADSERPHNLLEMTAVI
ncbi:hypothetical protein CWO89_03640 [Bradyrhizobium sp. Leo170]|nr:hypothetical protein CWO89_03640 [Bradyrhizobium sp. Leo170]